MVFSPKEICNFFLVQTKIFSLISNKLISDCLPFLEKKNIKASFLWTVISKQGSVTKLEHNMFLKQKISLRKMMHLTFSHVSLPLSFQLLSNTTFSQLCLSQISMLMRGGEGSHLSKEAAWLWSCAASMDCAMGMLHLWGTPWICGRGGKCCLCVTQKGWETRISPAGWVCSKASMSAIKIFPSVFDAWINRNFPRLRMESV